mgnify:CR=1 FL=1
MPNFFGGEFFDGGFYEYSGVARSGGGGIEGKQTKKRYPPFKPTGLLHLPKKKTTTKAEETVETRLQETHAERVEIADRLTKEFTKETEARFRPIQTMSMAEVEAEIGVLLRKEQKTREDEIMLFILIAASV